MRDAAQMQFVLKKSLQILELILEFLQILEILKY